MLMTDIGDVVDVASPTQNDLIFNLNTICHLISDYKTIDEGIFDYVLEACCSVCLHTIAVNEIHLFR